MSGRKPAEFRCLGSLEQEAREAGYELVAGVDEAGRGCLFGPVFAAAVILSPDCPVRGLNDSKLLTPARREELAVAIRERALAWAVAAADPYEIDRINIYQASRLAMKRAVLQLRPQANFLLVDAVPIDVPIPQKAIIHGDAQSHCIAAASILAKTGRDRCIARWHDVFPQFGLKQHKGYATAAHRDALARFGPTTLHRFSYEPVRSAALARQLTSSGSLESGLWT